jgi:hypothetical protein
VGKDKEQGMRQGCWREMLRIQIRVIRLLALALTWQVPAKMQRSSVTSKSDPSMSPFIYLLILT